MITHHPHETRPYWSFEGVDIFGRFFILEADTKAELVEAVLDNCMATTHDYAIHWASQLDDGGS